MSVNDEALCVRGYHIDKEIWEAANGETLLCVAEPENSHDRNTVAGEKDGKVIGCLPRKVSRLFTLFLKKGGNVHCTVTITAVQFFVGLIVRCA